MASRGLPSDDSDREGQIFLSHPHTNNGLFFLLNTKFEKAKMLSENLEYAEMLHGDVFLTLPVGTRSEAVWIKRSYFFGFLGEAKNDTSNVTACCTNVPNLILSLRPLFCLY